MGFPIVCDPLYGKQTRKSGGRRGIYLSSFKRNWQGDETEERPLLDRLGLHAARLAFGSTANIGGVTSLEAPLPRDMAALIKQMEKCRS
jgi:23S rRNA-/tRNA-specific pseudouridylate synthase